MFFFDFISTIIVMFVAIFVVFNTSRMPPALSGNMGPGYWTVFLGYCLLVLGAVLFVQTLLKRRHAMRRAAAGRRIEAKTPIDFASPGMMNVYGLFGTFAVFMVVLILGNFLAATVVFVPCVMRLLGEKRPAMLASLAIAVPITVYVIFVRILGITLP